MPGLVIGDPALQSRSHVPDARSGGGMDSVHRQAVCVCFLGGAPGGLGKRILAGSGGGVSGVARSRAGFPKTSSESRANGHHGLALAKPIVRSYLTENIHYQLDPGAREAAVVLSICRGNRGASGGASAAVREFAGVRGLAGICVKRESNNHQGQEVTRKSSCPNALS